MAQKKKKTQKDKKSAVKDSAADEEQQEKKKVTPSGRKAADAAVVDEDLNFIVRIAGVDLEGKLPVRQALMKIKGVGASYANSIINALEMDPFAIVGKFSEEERVRLEDAVKNPAALGLPEFVYNRRKDPTTGEDRHLVSADLLAANNRDVEFLKRIRCYRGIRHFYGMKLRGQRTKSRGSAVSGRVGRTVGVIKGKGKLQAAVKGQQQAAGKAKKKE